MKAMRSQSRELLGSVRPRMSGPGRTPVTVASVTSVCGGHRGQLPNPPPAAPPQYSPRRTFVAAVLQDLAAADAAAATLREELIRVEAALQQERSPPAQTDEAASHPSHSGAVRRLPPPPPPPPEEEPLEGTDTHPRARGSQESPSAAAATGPESRCAVPVTGAAGSPPSTSSSGRGGAAEAFAAAAEAPRAHPAGEPAQLHCLGSSAVGPGLDALRDWLPPALQPAPPPPKSAPRPSSVECGAGALEAAQAAAGAAAAECEAISAALQSLRPAARVHSVCTSNPRTDTEPAAAAAGAAGKWLMAAADACELLAAELAGLDSEGLTRKDSEGPAGIEGRAAGTADSASSGGCGATVGWQGSDEASGTLVQPGHGGGFGDFGDFGDFGGFGVGREEVGIVVQYARQPFESSRLGGGETDGAAGVEGAEGWMEVEMLGLAAEVRERERGREGGREGGRER